MKNEKETLTQDQSEQPKHRLMYSEAMAMVEEAFASRNLLAKEQLITAPKSSQDNPIKVTFFRQITIK